MCLRIIFVLQGVLLGGEHVFRAHCQGPPSQDSPTHDPRDTHGVKHSEKWVPFGLRMHPIQGLKVWRLPIYLASLAPILSHPPTLLWRSIGPISKGWLPPKWGQGERVLIHPPHPTHHQAREVSLSPIGSGGSRVHMPGQRMLAGAPHT